MGAVDDSFDNPYAAPKADLGPEFHEFGATTRFAGFWLRFVALFIDGLLLGVVVGLPAQIGIMVLTGDVPGMDDSDAEPSQAALIGVVLIMLAYVTIYVCYFALMESSSHQATLGKMALGLKVVDLQGRRISAGRAFGRFFSKILSYLTCYIGFLMAGFTEKKQALHDMIAGTLVVRP